MCYAIFMKYFRHKIENLITIHRIVTIHYFEFKKDFASAGESHDFWELVFADRESVFCRAGEIERELLPGEMIFHRPGEFHALRANGERAPNVFIISFECKSAAMGFFAGRRVRPSPACVDLIYQITKEAKRTFDIPYSDPDMKKLQLLPAPTLGGEQLIKNYLEILLINLMRDLTETEKGNRIFLPEAEFKSQLVADVTAILKGAVCGRLTVEDICRETSYSRSYIFREFRAETGRGVMEYYRALKIETAKKMLRESGQSVPEISELLGFDNPNYFSKVFRRAVGFTPAAYRRRAFSVSKNEKETSHFTKKEEKK